MVYGDNEGIGRRGYRVGNPLRIAMANGKVFTVVAKNLDKENRYIRAVKLNGKDYHQSFITHEQILSGATYRTVYYDKII